jgi:hypothetical protein
MKRFQFKPVVVALAILVVSMIAGTGCTNVEGNIDIVDYQEFAVIAPIELTVEKLQEDYQNDPIAADDKYKGKRLCFYGIEVEEVVNSMRSGGSSGIIKEYFLAKNVKFILIGGDTSSKMQIIEPGHLLNVVGECRGFDDMSVDIIIKSCWAEGINCDLGTEEILNPY